jgi:hypothetical protein
VTAGDLALVVAVVLCTLAFCGVVVLLLQMQRSLRELRETVDEMASRTAPLLVDLRDSVDAARDDLDRFDRVLGSAEAISTAVEGTSRVARVALSAPVIKTVAFASGTRRAASRLRSDDALPAVTRSTAQSARRGSSKRSRRRG